MSDRVRCWRVAAGLLLALAPLLGTVPSLAQSFDREEPDPVPIRLPSVDAAWARYLVSRTYAFGVPVECTGGDCGRGTDRGGPGDTNGGRGGEGNGNGSGNGNNGGSGGSF